MVKTTNKIKTLFLFIVVAFSINSCQTISIRESSSISANSENWPFILYWKNAQNLNRYNFGFDINEPEAWAPVLSESIVEQLPESIPFCLTAPFSTNYSPISKFSQLTADEYLLVVDAFLKTKEYKVNLNKILLSGETLPKHLGKLRWLKNRQKWDISYQVGFQFIQGPKSQVYWKLTYNIVGYRYSHEPRHFKPDDFDETRDIYNELLIMVSERLNKA